MVTLAWILVAALAVAAIWLAILWWSERVEVGRLMLARGSDREEALKQQDASRAEIRILTRLQNAQPAAASDLTGVEAGKHIWIITRIAGKLTPLRLTETRLDEAKTAAANNLSDCPWPEFRENRENRENKG